MSKDRVYLQHILDAIHKIESYILVGKDVFMRDSHWQDAVIRELEIIGEATKKISSYIREIYPEVPWKQVAGFRDVLIHDYMGVDLGVVWETTQQNLPDLKTQIQKIINLEK